MKQCSLTKLLAFLSLLVVNVQALDPTCTKYLTAIPGNTLGWVTTATGPSISIPGVLSTNPNYPNGYTNEEYVYCPDNEQGQSCLAVARAERDKCLPQWLAWSCSSSSFYAQITGTYYTTVNTYFESTVLVNYPTTIPTYETFAFQQAHGQVVRVTPIRVFGQPTTTTSIISTVSYTNIGTFASSDREGLYTAAKPFCSIVGVVAQSCGGSCNIYPGGLVQPYYWPDQIPGPDGSFPPVTAATPATTVVAGVTMTSPSVYVNVPRPYASDDCGRIHGQVYTNIMLSFDPWLVATPVNGYYDQTSSVYNFADLIPLVPAAAYERQLSCGGYGCATIYPDYSPPLTFPSYLSGLVPEWSGCYFSWRQVAAASTPIPLRPLTAGGPSASPSPPTLPPATLATSTVPTRFATSTVTAASPSSTLGSGTAAATATPA